MKLLHLELALLLLLSPLYAYAQGFGGVSGTGGVTGVGGGAGGVTWALEQDVINSGAGCAAGGAATCAVTISAPNAGDIIVFLFTDTNGQTITSVTGGTFTHCTAGSGNIGSCAVFNSGAGAAQDASYLLSAAGTETTLTANLTGNDPTFMQGEVVVLRRSSGTAILDASGGLSITSNCTACTGMTFTGTGSGDAQLQFFSAQNSSGSPFVNTPWTHGTGSGSDLGYLLNVAASTPTFNQTPTGQGVVTSLYFR